MKVVITGASGTIGTVLRKGLPTEWQIVGVDTVASDGVLQLNLISDVEKFSAILTGCDAVIHLAWDMREVGGRSGPSVPENREMARVVFETARSVGVKRILVASSVHVMFGRIQYPYSETVEDHKILHRIKKIHEDGLPMPISSYGESKVFIEKMGKEFSDKGLTVIMVRFGNVTPDNSQGEYPFWLSHRDCSEFVRLAITSFLPPFSIVNAISQNECNPFDMTTAEHVLGFTAQDGSICPHKE